MATRQTYRPQHPRQSGPPIRRRDPVLTALALAIHDAALGNYRWAIQWLDDLEHVRGALPDAYARLREQWRQSDGAGGLATIDAAATLTSTP
jgi:hypothetical protein